MIFIVSPFYGVSNLVEHFHANNHELVFVMTDEDSPIVQASERASWLLHTLQTSAINLTGVAESEETEEYMLAVDSAIRKFIHDNDINKDDVEIIFEVMDHKLFDNHFSSSFGKDGLKASAVYNLEGITLDQYVNGEFLSDRFNLLFADRISELLKPNVEVDDNEYHVALPVFTKDDTTFVAAVYDIRKGITAPITRTVKEYFPHTMLATAYSETLASKPLADIETFFKFVSLSDGKRYAAHFLDLGELEESALEDVFNGVYTKFGETSTLRILPLESIKTLSPDFAILHNVYEVGKEELKKQEELAFEVA